VKRTASPSRPPLVAPSAALVAAGRRYDSPSGSFSSPGSLCTRLQVFTSPPKQACDTAGQHLRPADLRALSSSFRQARTTSTQPAVHQPTVFGGLIAPLTAFPLPFAYALWSVGSPSALIWAWSIAAPYLGLRKAALLLRRCLMASARRLLLCPAISRALALLATACGSAQRTAPWPLEVRSHWPRRSSHTP